MLRLESGTQNTSSLPTETASDGVSLREASFAAASKDVTIPVFDVWYERYRSLVRKIVATAINNRADREDVEQEIWLKLDRAIHRFDPSRGTETIFISTIAKRAIIDFFRRSEVRKKIGSLSLDREDADGGSIKDQLVAAVPEVDEESMRHEQFVELRARMEWLSAVQAETLCDTYLREQTLREQSQIKEIPPGTVKSALSRGLKKLRAFKE